MNRKNALSVALSVLMLFAFSSLAQATFHFARIAEVFTGTAAHPGAQYIVIVPYANSQTSFATVRVTVFDAAGTPLPDFAVFSANLISTATNQRSILVATPTAQGILGIVPDQVATGLLPASGIVCFRKPLQVPDCVSYGNYLGSTLVGGSPAGPPASSIPSGAALRRDFGANGTLEAADDTNISEADFDLSGPAAENFARLRISTLAVSESGGTITLGWIGNAFLYTIHKTDDPATVRAAAKLDMTMSSTFTDPDPNQFPVSFYIVKP